MIPPCLRQVVDHFKRIKLIGDVLRCAEVRHQIVFPLHFRRNAIVVQVEWNASRTPIDIDCCIIELKPIPEVAGKWRIGVKVFNITMNNVRRHGQRQRKHAVDSKQLAEMSDAIRRRQKAVCQLLRADLHHRRVLTYMPRVS